MTKEQKLVEEMRGYARELREIETAETDHPAADCLDDGAVALEAVLAREQSLRGIALNPGCQACKAVSYALDAALPVETQEAASLTHKEKVALRCGVSELRKSLPSASALPDAESALRKLGATQEQTEATDG